MRITVTSDDGQTEATIRYHSESRVGEVAERICLGLSACDANDLIESITITERPAETEPDGFQFQIGQRVLCSGGREAIITERFINNRGYALYRLCWSDGTKSYFTWTAEELQDVEQT